MQITANKLHCSIFIFTINLRVALVSFGRMYLSVHDLIFLRMHAFESSPVWYVYITFTLLTKLNP